MYTAASLHPVLLGKANQAKITPFDLKHWDLCACLVAAEVAQRLEVRSFSCHAALTCGAGFPGSVNKVQTNTNTTGMLSISGFTADVI